MAAKPDFGSEAFERMIVAKLAAAGTSAAVR
jgi:hypothetical protein